MKSAKRRLVHQPSTLVKASALLALPSNAFLVYPIHSRHIIAVKRLQMSNNNRITPVSCENSMEDVPGINGASSNNTTSPSVPFPRSAYHLSRDEEEISHHFVSFINHFDEPYTHVSRLIEPRRYARSGQFDGQQVTSVPPTIDDLAGPPSSFGPLAKLLA